MKNLETPDERKDQQAISPELSDREPPSEACEVCSARMYGLHCKLLCPNCGYRRDCSDP